MGSTLLARHSVTATAASPHCWLPAAAPVACAPAARPPRAASSPALDCQSGTVALRVVRASVMRVCRGGSCALLAHCLPMAVARAVALARLSSLLLWLAPASRGASHSSVKQEELALALALALGMDHTSGAEMSRVASGRVRRALPRGASSSAGSAAPLLLLPASALLPCSAASRAQRWWL